MKVKGSLWNFSTLMETNKMKLSNEAHHLETNSYTPKNNSCNLFGQLVKLEWGLDSSDVSMLIS